MRSFLVSMLVIAACGGDGGSSDGPGADTPPGSIPPAEYHDGLAAAECDFAVRCELVEDRATCDAANILIDQEQKSLLAAIADGTVAYDGQAAKRCLELLSMQGCSFAGFHVDNPCDDVFRGTVAPGGACFIDGQCANRGSCNQNDGNCDIDVACCIGTCAGALTESPITGPCGDNLHYCARDAYCRGTTCTALVATEGAACDALVACADPMACTGATSGVCKTPAATGATCVRTDVRPCADSRDFCDATSLTCTRSAAPGASCANAVCVDYAKCIQNTCVADKKLGETCTTGAGAADCAGTLECTGGQCTAPPAGMTCAL